MRDRRFGDSFTISNSNYYNLGALEGLFKDLQELLKEAEAEGLKDAYLVFSSTMEAYEDYLGPVEVNVWGYRPLTVKEVEEEAKEKLIYKLAEELGVSFYEASVVHSLKSRGKI